MRKSPLTFGKDAYSTQRNCGSMSAIAIGIVTYSVAVLATLRLMRYAR